MPPETAPRSPARLDRDVIAGLVFMAFGTGFAILSLAYPLGRVARIGPGFFPLLLSLILLLIGLVIAGRALRRSPVATESASPIGPIAVVLAIIGAACVAVLAGLAPRSALFAGVVCGMATAFALGQRAFALVLAPITLFALLLESAGLLLSAVVLVGVSTLASSDSRWPQSLALSIGLALFVWAIFVLGLGLRIPVLPALG